MSAAASSPTQRRSPGFSAAAGAFGLVPRSFVVLFAAIMSWATSTPVLAQQPSAAAQGTRGASSAGADKPTIVLVHGAFADASGWLPVITLLQRDGYRVVAVQNALASLAGDVETTRRLIDAQAGPVVVVGHSYGGAVISAAAAGNPHVRALVYIAAFAPEAGEPVAAFLQQYPSDLGTATVPDAAGFLYVDLAKFHDVFAGDLPLDQTRAVAAAQKPIAGAIFGQSAPAAAWKTIPSWYLLTLQDHAINPALERFYADRMHAHTTEIGASHVVFLSHPREVANLIVQAATSGGR
jgi:pimeloyl-ACP methyl ester carboxylesterase